MGTEDNVVAESRLHELRHRFRNSLQIVNSLVGLHARGLSDPAAVAAFSDLRSRLAILSTIFMALDEEEETGSVDLHALLPQIAHKAANLQPSDVACPLELDIVPAQIEPARAAIVAQILAEMLMQAFRRCGRGANPEPIEVRLTDAGGERLALVVGIRGAVGGGEEAAANTLSNAIVKSMAATLDASFAPGQGTGAPSRLEFARTAASS